MTLTPDYKQQKKLFITLGILFSFSIILGILKLTVFKSETKEESLYATYYELGKKIAPDEKQREIFAHCLVEKFKVRYGDRFEEVDFNDPKNINESDVEACSEHITKISWTKLAEERILKKFSSMEELEGFTEKQKMDYAECILSKLKSIYPNGLNGSVPQKDMDELYLNCLAVLQGTSEHK
jgi:hypothetical protein